MKLSGNKLAVVVFAILALWNIAYAKGEEQKIQSENNVSKSFSTSFFSLITNIGEKINDVFTTENKEGNGKVLLAATLGGARTRSTPSTGSKTINIPVAKEATQLPTKQNLQPSVAKPVTQQKAPTGNASNKSGQTNTGSASVGKASTGQNSTAGKGTVTQKDKSLNVTGAATSVAKTVAADSSTSKLVAPLSTEEELTKLKKSAESAELNINNIYKTLTQLNRIDTLRGVAISNVTFANNVVGLTDAMIPNDITVSSYLPLAGGTMTGALVGPSAVIASIGVGTTSPFLPLSVVGGATASYYRAENSSATSTFLGGLAANLINVTSSTATSTFANGIDLSSGCFSVNGSCVTGAGGGGSGTVNSGTAKQVAFYSADGTTVSGTSTLALLNEKVGIGTSTPWGKLSVSGGNIMHVASGSPALVSSVATTQNASSTFIVGKTAYVISNSGSSTGTLDIIDISNVNAPVVLSTLANEFNGANDITVSGKYAYITNGGDVRIIDASNKKAPVNIGSMSLNGYAAGGTSVSGRYAYVPMGGEGVGIGVFDVSKPTAPVQVASIAAGAGEMTTHNGNVTRTFVSGNYLYVIWGGNQVGAVDIRDPLNPVDLGYLNIGSPVQQGLYVSGKYLYATAGTQVRIVDVSNPSSITTGYTYDTGVTTWGINVSGDYVYVANDTAGLTVLDVSDPTNPTLVGSYTTGGIASDVKVSGKYAYVADGAGGLKILDINGLKTPAITTGSLFAGSINVSDSIDVENVLRANEVRAGAGGLFSDSGITVYGTTTPSSFMGKVGISTSTPANMLSMEVSAGDGLALYSGGGYYSNVFSVITDAGDINNGVLTMGYGVGNTTVSLNSNGSSYLRGGNFGLGTASPSYKLDVAGNINIDQFSAYKQAGDNILYASSTTSSLAIGGGAAPWMVSTSSVTENIAIGLNAMSVTPTNAGVTGNVAVGLSVLSNNTTGHRNTAMGNQALMNNTEGAFNTAIGNSAAVNNTLGNVLVAIGNGALTSNTIGNFNVGVGRWALYSNTTGDDNIGIGDSAGYGDGTADQRSVIDTYSTFIGYQASRDAAIASTTILTNATAIGKNARVGASNSIVLGGTGVDAVNVGIGTTSPWGKLSISGGNIIHVASSSPTLLGSIVTAYNASSTQVVGKLAYVTTNDGAGNSNLTIINIASSTPSIISTLAIVSDARDLFVSGKYAYVGDGGVVAIINVSDSKNPYLVSTVGVSGDASNLYASGKYLYVPAGGSGTRIYDISDPVTPSLITTIATDAGNAQYAFVSGRFLYLIGGGNWLRAVDINDPANPVKLGYIPIGSNSPHGLYVSGRHAYIPSDTVLQIVDVSDPNTLVAVGSYDVGTSIRSVYVAGDYAYIAAETAGVVVVDVSNPSSPTLVGSYTTGGVSGDVVVSGKKAYVADGSGGFKILDINGLKTPAIETGSIFAGSINVSETVTVANSLFAEELRSGISGIKTDGGLFAAGTTTSSVIMGSLGLGTSTPGAKLDVIGAVCVDDETPTCGDSARTSGTVYAVAAFSQSLDLAESYPTKDQTLAAGDMVALDPVNPVFVNRATTGSGKVLGIVSTKPGLYLGGFNSDDFKLETKVPVALSGRVPVKVNLDGGAISIGDSISISSVAGVGKKALSNEDIVGVALEPFDGSDTAKNTILVFVNLSYSRLSNVSEGQQVAQPFDLQNLESIKVGKILSTTGKWSVDETGVFVVSGLTIGTAENPSGITLFDKETKQPTCLEISNGAVVISSGQCGATAPNSQSSLPEAGINEQESSQPQDSAQSEVAPVTGDN
jgi:hypothetical protein